MPEGQPPALRIAHGYGNRRWLIARALEAGVDAVEADLRYRDGEVWVRHERRAPLLPILYNWRLGRSHRRGPWALSLGPLFLRLDVRPVRLEELIARAGTGAGLLLDLKADRYPAADASAFVERALRCVRDGGASGRTEFCGSWRLLDVARRADPLVRARYSVDTEGGWKSVQPRLADGSVTAVSVRGGLLTEERAASLRARGVDFYVWSVRGAADAGRAVALGASGVICSDLGVLGGLGTGGRAGGGAA
jgi:glycerophosphoryl diester phosphodiesterase